MRLPLVLLFAASAVSLPQGNGGKPPAPPGKPVPGPLPNSAFPTFDTISLDDAREGVDLLTLFGSPNRTSAPDVQTFGIGDEDEEPAFTALDAASCQANPHVRLEWRRYSSSDKLAFVNSIRCLMNRPPSGNFPPATNRYEDLVRVHQMWMPNIHNNAKFLIWHRYYLWVFEQLLRTECGFNRAFPWWDETLDAGRFAQSDIFSPSYFGSLPRPVNGQGVCVTNGAFAGVTLNIGPGTSNVPHCLSRGVDESLTAQANQGFVNTCNSRSTYASMSSCAEPGPHAYTHNGIGSVMSDVSASPSDPIFWMHHSFIDHNFRIWQNADVARRTTTIDGTDVAGNPLTMNMGIFMAGIRPDTNIRSILNTLGGVEIGGVPFCYRYDY